MPSGARRTIHEVAKRAGVSTATVSNVLNGKGRASAESARMVLKAARELGYSGNRAAAELRSGKSRILAAIVPSLENPFFTALVAAFEQRASAAGYELVVASAGEDPKTEASRVAALLSWRPAGVFLVPCDDRARSASAVTKAGVPLVIVDRGAGKPKADTIHADNFGAGHAAAVYLAELGHRRLLVIASALSLANVRERCAGVAHAVAALGLPPAAVVEIGKDFGNAAEALERWIAAHGAPDAAIALTNFATLGAISGLAQAGRAIPRDVSLVGFDDYAWMRAFSPAITAVGQPIDRMGEIAWTRLKERIDGSGAPPRLIHLPCRLETRSSAMARATPSAGPLQSRSEQREELT